MLSSLLLVLFLSDTALAAFANVFGFPSSACRSCLTGIYGACESLHAYDEGQTSDFSNCICSLSSLSDVTTCVSGACLALDPFQVPDHILVSSQYLSWCLSFNTAARMDACRLAGPERQSIEQSVGIDLDDFCNGNQGEASDGSSTRGGTTTPTASTGAGLPTPVDDSNTDPDNAIGSRDGDGGPDDRSSDGTMLNGFGNTEFALLVGVAGFVLA